MIEVLLALSIFGIAGVAIISGLTLSATISGKDRGQSSAATYVRDFAEQIEKTVAGGGYASNGSYSWTPPSGTVVITSKQCLTKASAASTSPSWVACPSDGNAQLLTLRATATNGSVESLTILVRKPCTGSSAGDTC